MQSKESLTGLSEALFWGILSKLLNNNGGNMLKWLSKIIFLLIEFGLLTAVICLGIFRLLEGDMTIVLTVVLFLVYWYLAKRLWKVEMYWLLSVILEIILFVGVAVLFTFMRRITF